MHKPRSKEILLLTCEKQQQEISLLLLSCSYLFIYLFIPVIMKDSLYNKPKYAGKSRTFYPRLTPPPPSSQFKSDDIFITRRVLTNDAQVKYQ